MFEKNKIIFIAIPGVPSEMKYMMNLEAFTIEKDKIKNIEHKH